MKNSAKFFLRFVRVGAVLTVLGILIPYRPVITPSGRCIFDFDTFAYRPSWMIERWPGSGEDFILPLRPWEYRQHTRAGWTRVKFSRLINGEQELWFLTHAGFPPQRGFVFNRDAKVWRELKLAVTNSNQENQFDPVFDFIADHDGQVWGLASQRVMVDGRQRAKPVVVRYREERGDFVSVFVSNDENVRSSRDSFNEDSYLLVDQQNRVWFVTRSAFVGYKFYVYDPRSETFEELTDYQQSGNYHPHVTISNDGEVYLSTIVFDNWPPYYQPTQADFVRYDAESEQWVNLDLPDGFQPREGNLGFDPQGRLHIGTSGWRDSDGTWHITEPYPAARQDAYPRIVLKFISSDGRLWFVREDSDLEGAAWYDPSTGKGCMFTNLTPDAIIEDHQQYLWMVVNGEIYRLDLNAE